MRILLITLSVSFFSSLVFPQDISNDILEDKSLILDPVIRSGLNHFNIRPLETPPKNPNRFQVELGKKLFSDTILSGNKRMSCQTCHNPATGTSDSRPMSQTEDGKGILRRNSPNLFNVGVGNKSFMFWDGRVHYNFKNKIFSTPEVALNGDKPKASAVTSAMTSALSAQALFPMVNPVEMLGKKGENEIADAKDNLEAWDRIMKRLKDNKTYNELFLKAYPAIPRDKINIGHVAEAIASFEREEFQSMGSPFQRYLRGDNSAMTKEQKKGLIVFMGKGRCIQCHQGSELGNNSLFASSASPQWGEVPYEVDKGRGEIVKDSSRNYFFKVPSLLNVALTAPYMHNGAYQSLDEIINHYDHISYSLSNYELSNERRAKIPVDVEVERNPKILDDIWLSSQGPLTPELKNNICFGNLEKAYLKIFLSEALTDPKWKKKN